MRSGWRFVLSLLTFSSFLLPTPYTDKYLFLLLRPSKFMARAGVRSSIHPPSLSLSSLSPSLPLPLTPLLPLRFAFISQYNPRAAVSLWELMACVESDAAAAGQPISLGGEKFEFLQTHPNNGQRQRYLERLLPRALDLWKEAKKAGTGDGLGLLKVGGEELRGVKEGEEGVGKVVA